MAAKLPMTNFSKGEFAPLLYARVDVPQYQAGAKRIENFTIQRYGGLSFRPGFRFAGEVDNVDHNYRMVPFAADQNQGFIQLFGDLQMRVMAQGGFVLEEDLKIVSVTTGATTIFEIPFHDFAVGDRLYLDGNTGMPLDGRFVEVLSVPDADHVEVDVDSTGFAALTDSTGIVRVEAPDPPSTPPDPLPDPTPPPPPPPIGGGGGTGGGLGGGGGGYCVAADAWVETEEGFKLGREIVAGDMLRVLADDRESTRWERCTHNHVERALSWLLRTVTGIELYCSAETPVTLRDGSMILVPEVAGHELPVQAQDSFRWEKTWAEEIGEIEVAHISCSRNVYAAGNVKGWSILTHNALSEKSDEQPL